MQYNPYQYMPGQYQQPYNALVFVNGDGGAEAFAMPPNSVAVLFDSNADIMYYKTTDAGGYATIRRYSFAEVKSEPQQGAEYVTTAEFQRAIDELKEAIANGKQSVPASDGRKQPNGGGEQGAGNRGR